MRLSKRRFEDLVQPSRLILFASYEERCLSIGRAFSEAGYSGQVEALYCSDATSPEVTSSLDTLDRLFDGRCVRVPVSVRDPRAAIAFAASLRPTDRVFVDVTCFNRENLFAFLWAWQLDDVATGAVHFGYTPASSYGPWLMRDFGRPHNLVGFGGSAQFASRRELICLVGFDGDRALALIDYLEPTRVVLAVGTNPTQAEFQAKNQEAIQAISSRRACDVVALPVTDPGATEVELEALIANCSGDDIVHIAPFNNKLSCLATYAVWLRHRSIRLWNTLPVSYNFIGYSQGSGQPLFFEWR